MRPDRRAPWTVRFLYGLFTPTSIRAEMIGDLNQRFDEIAQTEGSRRARLWAWRQLVALRPAALRQAASGASSAELGGMMGKGFVYDLRMALRALIKRPSATLVVIGTVAAAIGGSTAVFSVVNGVLLKPLSYPDSHRIVRVHQVKHGWLDHPNSQLRSLATRFPLSMPTLRDWEEADLGFDAIGAMTNQRFITQIEGRGELLPGQSVTGGLFDVLGVEPLLGRTITPVDDEFGADAVAVLGHGLWMERYGGATDALGSTIVLSGTPHEIVGVMPPGFGWLNSNVRVWTNLGEEDKLGERRSQFLSVIGRLGAGQTSESAATRVESTQASLAELYPEAEGDNGSRVEGLLDSMIGDVRSTLWLLLGSVILVLVIACLNIATVLSIQALDRRRELAVRSAMGADAGRLIRTMMAESLMLTGVGGVLGIIVAAASLPILTSLIPGTVPRADIISMDLSVVGFGLGATLLTGLVVGTLPALQALRSDPGETIKSKSTGGGERSGNRLRSGFVIVEMSLAFTLLVGSGLIALSFNNLWNVDRGFDVEGLVQLVVTNDANADPGQAVRDQDLRLIRQQLSAIPGVEVTATNQTPLSGSMSSVNYTVERPGGEIEELGVALSSVMETYFDVMRIPLLEGRSLEASDTDDAPGVAVVNRAMAEAVWPAESAIGKRVRDGTDGEWTTIVGVVGDVLHQGLSAPAEPKLYIPVWQTGRSPNQWLLRSGTDLGAVIQLAREAIQTASPGRVVSSTAILEETVSGSVAVERFRSLFSMGLAMLAGLLALIGVYGVVAFSIGQQSRDLAVRMAIGARSGEVVWDAVARGISHSLVGVGIGLAMTWALADQVSRFLYEVEASDARVLISVALGVVAISALAAWLPARRITRIDPVAVLRSD